MADGKTKTETLHKPRDLKPPCIPVPSLPAVCEKNVFRCFRSSANGKPHLYAHQMHHSHAQVLFHACQ